MAQATLLPPPVRRAEPPAALAFPPPRRVRFESLLLTEQTSLVRGRSAKPFSA